MGSVCSFRDAGRPGLQGFDPRERRFGVLDPTDPGAAEPEAGLDMLDPAENELGRVAGRLSELDVLYERGSKALWCYLMPGRVPSFTPSLLRELHDLHATIRSVMVRARGEAAPLAYYVQGSRIPGIYNMGGDFSFMAECVRRGDRDALRRYAYDCVEAVHSIATGFGGPVISISLIEGDALGGGLEGALCCNYLVAERSAKFGLPEIMFNSFPGMGAYSFLSRRIGVRQTEDMILSGRIYSAEEMRELGVVDLVVDDGRGRQAVLDYMQGDRRSHSVKSALFKVRQRVNPITLEELRDVTDLWVETALELAHSDLRRMAHLQAAQTRRLSARP